MANDSPKDYMNFLLPIIAVCDNDKAGRKLVKFGHYIETPETDLSDASDDYIQYLMSKYI